MNVRITKEVIVDRLQHKSIKRVSRYLCITFKKICFSVGIAKRILRDALCIF